MNNLVCIKIEENFDMIIFLYLIKKMITKEYNKKQQLFILKFKRKKIS